MSRTCIYTHCADTLQGVSHDNGDTKCVFYVNSSYLCETPCVNMNMYDIQRYTVLD